MRRYGGYPEAKKKYMRGSMWQKCTWCFTWKPLDKKHFPPNNNRKPKGTHRRPYCRECHRAYNRAYMKEYRATGRVKPQTKIKTKIGQLIWNAGRKMKTIEKKIAEVEADLAKAMEMKKRLVAQTK